LSIVQQNTPKKIQKDLKNPIHKKGLSNTVDFKRNNELNNTNSNSHANTEKKFDNVSGNENKVDEKERLFKKNVINSKFKTGQVGDINFDSIASNLNEINQSIAIEESFMDNRSRTISQGRKASKPPKRKKTVQKGIVNSKTKTGKAEVITAVKQKSNFNVKRPTINKSSVSAKPKKNIASEIQGKALDNVYVGSIENDVQYYENEIKEHQRDLSKHESKQRKRQESRSNSNREIYIDGNNVNSILISDIDERSKY